MQFIARTDGLVRVQVIPALAALVLRPAVPDDAQCLQPATGQLNQVLLEGVNPERVGNGVVRQFAVGAVGADMVGTALAVKGGGGTKVLEGGVISNLKPTVAEANVASLTVPVSVR